MCELRELAPGAGSYSLRIGFLPSRVAGRILGPRHPGLLAVKERYDPPGLSFVRHGVGSAGWIADGFTRAG